MKWLSILLCLYMTILAVLPCRDKDEVNPSPDHAVVHKEHQSNEKSDNEACTPFCACSCCSTVRALTPQSTLCGVCMRSVAQTYGEQPILPLLKQSITIWQPPKLA